MSRVSFVSRLMLLGGTSAALPVLFACLDHPLKQVEYEPSGEEMEGIAISINKDVDILFVIDNSGSMGEEQQNLSENFGSLLNVLEAEDVRANYRIGITTTDNGNPFCTGGGEAGNLVLQSCRSRLQDFVFEGGDEVTDRSEACTAFCPEEWETITTLPTPTREEPTPDSRPWIESIEGVTNLPAGLTPTQALQCVGPQGISGCGFEQHLESMYLTLIRAERPDEPAYGFIRDNAILAIVFVTDEAECSHNRDAAAIFLPDGGRTFWSDKTSMYPSSAVCWNAGVQCVGAGPVYETCEAVNKDINGNVLPEDADPAASVLHPLSRYTSAVQALENDKRGFNPDQEVLVAAISGVPINYPTEEIQYSATGATANDPNFPVTYGIGPGCVSTVAEAVPPVRLREFAERFQVGTETNLFSVCNEDYGPALDAIADRIRDQIRPACMPACVADADPVTPGLNPMCILQKRTILDSGSEVMETLPPCVNGEVPDGNSACYIELTTPEEMDPQCVEEGWNLEFEIIETQGNNSGGASAISATCSLSQDKTTDCPRLPG